ncbi:hypothetical protein V8F33_010451 [Rhypophila sp. PSN 637]
MDISGFADNTPAMLPPPGVTPNFVNPESIAYQPRIVICTFMPLMFVFLGARVYARVCMRHNFGFDDVLAIISSIVVTAYCVSVLMSLDNPNGIHQWNVKLSRISESYLKNSLVTQITFPLSAASVKVSLLVLYLRIFRPVNAARYIILTGTALISVFYITLVIVAIVVTVPKPGAAGGWLFSVYFALPHTRALSGAAGIFGAITDFFVLAIPMSLVVPLRLATRKKIGIVAIFLAGLLACGCSIASCIFRFRMNDTEDQTWSGMPAYSLGVAEVTVGHICGSCPVVAVVFKSLINSKQVRSVLSYFKSSGSGSGSAGKRSNEEGKSPSPSWWRLPSTRHGAAGALQVDVPGGRLVTLKSFIRKAYQSSTGTRPQKTVQTGISAWTDFGLESMDMDYHGQLKKTYSPTHAHNNFTTDIWAGPGGEPTDGKVRAHQDVAAVV